MIDELKQYTSVLTVSLHIPTAQSLKDKRMVLKSIKDKIRAKFNVSVVELEASEKWQLAHLGVAMISSDTQIIKKTFQQIFDLIELSEGCQICEHNVEHY